MNPVNLVAAAFVALGVGLMYAAIAGTAEGLLSRMRSKTSQRLARLVDKDETDPFRTTFLNDRPLAERLFGSAASDLARWVGNVMGNTERDAALLIEAGFPPPFRTLGDFYGWKVIGAFLMFFMALAVAGMSGRTFFVYVAFAAGVGGLFLPDFTLRQAAHRRRESFRAEMAFTLDRLAMMLGAGAPPEEAIRRIAGGDEVIGEGVAEDALRKAAAQGGGLFAMALRGVVADVNSGRRSLVEALREVQREFPLDEYQAFVDLISLSIEQGSPLVSTLGDMADNLQNDIETELLGKGLQTGPRMVLYTGLAMVNVFVLILPPLMTLWL